MKYIDRYLDSITMYRLVLYYLIGLLGVATVFATFGWLPFSPLLLLGSTIFIVGVSLITNTLFAQAFQVVPNTESVFISALILALILSPTLSSWGGLGLLFWASVLTMASKYLLAIRGKHLFNPVAVAVVLTALGFGGTASWWVGTSCMLPFALLGWGIVRKIRKSDMMIAFFITATLTMLGYSVASGGNMLRTLQQIAFSSPIFFFAFVMLTEPLTTPATKRWQVVYGALVGVLFAPQFHIGGFYTTPESALVLGNAFSYLVSPKQKAFSTVIQKIQTAPDMLDFILRPQQRLQFKPGQYMEWTVPHKKPDSRGNRRYLTIASSPTEDAIRLGIKYYANGSSYKKALIAIDSTTQVVGAQLSGDFVLPKNKKQKLAFIAGGIGITPFRSMIKYLVDTNEARDAILLYSNKTHSEIVYTDVFQEAQQKLGIKTVYTLTDRSAIEDGWKGWIGRIDAKMIQAEVPDYRERIFYLSGPHTMVSSYEKTLKDMGVSPSRIKTDFFPGFA